MFFNSGMHLVFIEPYKQCINKMFIFYEVIFNEFKMAA